MGLCVNNMITKVFLKFTVCSLYLFTQEGRVILERALITESEGFEEGE